MCLIVSGLLWTATEVASATQIDATLDENKPLATRYGIGGFPTMKVCHALRQRGSGVLPRTFIKRRPQQHSRAAAAYRHNAAAFPPCLNHPVTLGLVQIFRNGKVDAPSDYNGPREAAGIVSYLEKVSGPASAELKTAEEVRTLNHCCLLAVTAHSAGCVRARGGGGGGHFLSAANMHVFVLVA